MCNSSYPKHLPFLHAVFPSSCCHIFPAPAPPFSKTPSKRCLLSLYLSPFSLALTPFGLISFPLHEMSLVNVSPKTCTLQTSFLIFLNLLVAFEQVTTLSAVKRIPHSSRIPFSCFPLAPSHSPLLFAAHFLNHQTLVCSRIQLLNIIILYTHWHGVSQL